MLDALWAGGEGGVIMKNAYVLIFYELSRKLSARSSGVYVPKL